MNKIKNLNYTKIIALVFLIAVLTGCVATKDPSNQRVAGFLTGLWHGWIAPFALIGSFFNPHVAIYQSLNSGFSYDLGYYMAIISGFGGIALKRRKKEY